jgi:hypothetical protein
MLSAVMSSCVIAASHKYSYSYKVKPFCSHLPIQTGKLNCFVFYDLSSVNFISLLVTLCDNIDNSFSRYRKELLERNRKCTKVGVFC